METTIHQELLPFDLSVLCASVFENEAASTTNGPASHTRCHADVTERCGKRENCPTRSAVTGMLPLVRLETARKRRSSELRGPESAVPRRTHLPIRDGEPFLNGDQTRMRRRRHDHWGNARTNNRLIRPRKETWRRSAFPPDEVRFRHSETPNYRWYPRPAAGSPEQRIGPRELLLPPQTVTGKRIHKKVQHRVFQTETFAETRPH